ncbi:MULTISPECIES: PP2C family protein-serine/threonine phosphatase [unclassified Knoellia]|uniref:PP2C family protein-serine/threonine phosphatase n=1 Tax=Knoellia altitudinis TaxID=3404795 RepID=UPI00360CD6D3
MDVGRILQAAEAAAPVDAIEQAARELGRAFDAVSVSFLIADLSGRALVRMAHVPLERGPVAGRTSLAAGERREEEESATVLPFDGGPAEQAIRTQTLQVLPPSGTGEGLHPGLWRVLAPVTERGESIGLLELHLPERPDRDELAQIGQMAHALAFVVIANRRHTDLYEWGQRTRSFSLSAEIQQRLLPHARTCEAAAFTLAGWLEPAATIGGDTFDYSLARDLLHLSLTDAMGHGVDAALTASTCLGSLRGTRRQGGSLVDQVDSANEALVDHGEDTFVTGLVARLDLRTAALHVVNAGHVAPYLLRGADVLTMDLRVDLPLGMFGDTTYGTTTHVLEPGDRLVLITDGMLERNVASVDLPETLRATRALHPREAVRALADAALAAAGNSLEDDATVLCVDWHGRHDEPRRALGGAEPLRASARL